MSISIQLRNHISLETYILEIYIVCKIHAILNCRDISDHSLFDAILMNKDRPFHENVHDVNIFLQSFERYVQYICRTIKIIIWPILLN